MPTSILTGLKKQLGLEESYVAFDPELIMHVNAVLSDMNQLGVGPKAGFAITDKTKTWEDFMGADPRLNHAMTYLFLKVRMLFDPPQVGYVVTAYEKQIEEAAWRLTVQAEDLSTVLVGGFARLKGNKGDTHIFRLANPAGETFINSSSQYEAEFVSGERRHSCAVTADLDLSEVADGVLKLPITIETGVYKIRLVEPRRTLVTIEVTAV